MDTELLERYNRQLLYSKWGEEGQKKISKSTIFVAGSGGLGSPVLYYLVAAGVGRVRICDFDEIELSNLNRQILHNENRIGMKKVISAQKTLSQLNSNVKIEAFTEKITASSIERLVGDSDVILDCLDNIQTRHVINEFAFYKGIPWFHAAVYGFEGRISCFSSQVESPCYSCMVPDEGVNKEATPVVGAIAGAVGSMQAAEAIKFVTGIGTPIKNKIMIMNFDNWNMHTLPIRKNPTCNICS